MKLLKIILKNKNKAKGNGKNLYLIISMTRESRRDTSYNFNQSENRLK